MPNTPALYGAGVTALFANEHVTAQQATAAESILAAAGHVIWVERRNRRIDAVTAVSGSGPAYFFYLMEAMIDAGIALGLDAETARTLTLKTAYGAAVDGERKRHRSRRVASQRHLAGRHDRTRRSRFSTAGRVEPLIERAVREAAQRSVELAKEFAAQ